MSYQFISICEYCFSVEINIPNVPLSKNLLYALCVEIIVSRLKFSKNK